MKFKQISSLGAMSLFIKYVTVIQICYISGLFTTAKKIITISVLFYRYLLAVCWYSCVRFNLYGSVSARNQGGKTRGGGNSVRRTYM